MAHKAAADYIKTVASAANAAPAKEKQFVCQGWDAMGGRMLEEALQNTDLVDAQYLIKLAELKAPVPRWQDIPEEARINAKNIWRLKGSTLGGFGLLPVLVMSYCWLSPEHPDPAGEQLSWIVPILQAMVAFVQKTDKKMSDGGRHCTVGVMQDFLSMPQKPRTPEEDERFDKALKTELNLLYMHPKTPVLIMDRAPGKHAKYTNLRPYHARGWCYMEMRLSSIVKGGYCLWELSKFSGNANMQAIIQEMKAGRPPLTSPDMVAADITGGIKSGDIAFTSNSDADIVIKIYEKGFKRAFETYHEYRPDCVIMNQRLGWGSMEVPIIAQALAYASEKCTVPKPLKICLGGNNFTGPEGKALEGAAKNPKINVIMELQG